ncbi:MAG: hypothetical protein IAC55_02125 [Tyzzerella sp.]|uniref:Uncharacterized protein n=1 Tax=Candidatus Fimicola merdigallinarum TaxID=2840819 RepID=A0A9D9H2K6_9FIRM|nr:hypothetical protein [Candidatus Fimicola merdigallinarum]
MTDKSRIRLSEIAIEREECEKLMAGIRNRIKELSKEVADIMATEREVAKRGEKDV